MWSLDSLYVSIDGMDTQLFSNALDIFAERILVFFEIVTVVRITTSPF